MNPIDILSTYYPAGSEVRRILFSHSRDVADKALAVARRHPELKPDLNFLEEAALLHDIGIFLCNAPEIDCHGQAEYICHGYLGADLLRGIGYPRHALVCERHTGAGISLCEIREQKLPLPQRDLLPLSIEEKIICYADKFFSKTSLGKEKTPERIQKSLAKYGADSLLRFQALEQLFG
ncbi:MAG: HDIG domain-containing protein [Tannerella sp.]|nr:HDIG domain-containing protein [Tannerella sp.]